MARMSKAEKVLDKAFDDAFRRLGNNVQFNIMDLGKLRSESVAAASNGMPMDEAVKVAIAKYRQN